jgi:hypothetical protein
MDKNSTLGIYQKNAYRSIELGSMNLIVCANCELWDLLLKALSELFTINSSSVVVNKNESTLAGAGSICQKRHS